MRRTSLVFLVLFGCVGCDQATKQLARLHLSKSDSIILLGDTLRLRYTENPGAFLSLGAQIPEFWRFALLTLLVGACLAGLLIYLLRDNRIDRTATLALSLILGGGIGNLIDRIVHQGRVIDFLNLGIGPVRTGIFNVADVAISLGAVGLVLLWAGQILLPRKP